MGKVAEISMLNYSAEDIFGPVSAEVGLYLMELADFLEECGRLEESQVMVSRYHSILLKLIVKSCFFRSDQFSSENN